MLFTTQPHINNSSCHHLLQIPSSSPHPLHPNFSNTSSLITDTQPRSSSDGPNTHSSKLSPRTSTCSSISRHKQQPSTTTRLTKKKKTKYHQSNHLQLTLYSAKLSSKPPSHATSASYSSPAALTSAHSSVPFPPQIPKFHLHHLHHRQTQMILAYQC